eukprot:279978_1
MSVQERTNLIIYGYIRRISSSLLIPEDINKIVIRFVDNHFAFYLQYKWNINLKTILLQLKNATNPLITFTCPDIMKVNSCHFQLYVMKRLYTDSFNLYIKPLKIPYDIKRILVYQKLYCPDIGSSYSYIQIYHKNKTGQWPIDCLKFTELKQRKLNSITIIADIRILKRIYFKNVKKWISIPIYYHKPFMKQSFIWTLNGVLMQLIHDAYPGKHFESNVMNNLWCLRIAPNGMGRTWRDSVDIYLVLCSLPPNVYAISVKWKLIVKELNMSIDREAKFSVKKCSDCWSDNKALSFVYLRKYDILNFYVEVEILKLYDQSQNEINELDCRQFISG